MYKQLLNIFRYGIRMRRFIRKKNKYIVVTSAFQHREVGAPPEKMARIVEVTVKKGMPKKASINDV